MIPQVSDVFTRARANLDHSGGNVAPFTDAVLQEALAEGYDILFAAFLEHQLPRIQNSTLYVLPANTTSLTPATASITDFGELIALEERLNGSTEKYTQLWEYGVNLPQIDAADQLRYFIWRLDTFYFLGATTARQLRLTYYASGTAPTTGTLGVDGSLVYFGNITAAIAGRRKGHDEWKDLWKRAVGENYEKGYLGGDLWRLIQPMDRSTQRVRIQPRAFSLSRGVYRRPPAVHVAAQGGSMAPTRISIALGNMTGTVDGVNATFTSTLGPVLRHVQLFLNGIGLNFNVGFTFSGSSITFLTGYIPQAGDDFYADVWI